MKDENKALSAINCLYSSGYWILRESIDVQGQFVYHERIEFEGIGKTPIYGNAYVSAFLDNENGRPKIQPGQCRIIKRGLPDDAVDILQNQLNEEFTFIREEKRHFYYYWNVNHPEEIDNFLAKYKDIYQLKFTGMLESLRGINR